MKIKWLLPLFLLSGVCRAEAKRGEDLAPIIDYPSETIYGSIEDPDVYGRNLYRVRLTLPKRDNADLIKALKDIQSAISSQSNFYDEVTELRERIESLEKIIKEKVK